MAKNQDWSLEDDIKANLADIADEVSSMKGSAAREPTEPFHPDFLTTELPQQLGAESRQAVRYSVNWKIALIFDKEEHKPTYHGRTHNLSLSGTGMLTGTNLYAESPVIILLAPPPLHVGHSQKVIEIQAKQQYVVYSGEAKCFRLGFAFLEFKNHGFNILRDRLEHHQPVGRMALTKVVS